jgi:hypothetical protein
MIDRIKKAICVAAAIAFGGAFSIGLACWTLMSWQDKPLLSLAFWIALGLVGFHAGKTERGNNGIQTEAADI